MKRIIFAFFVSAVLIGGVAEAGNWVKLRETNTGTAFYDSETMVKSGKLVSVAVKFSYTPEGVTEFRKAFPDIPTSRQVSYTLYAYEIDCGSKAFRIFSAATYDNSGLVIKGTKMEPTESEPEVEHITPKSILEQLFYAACTVK